MFRKSEILQGPFQRFCSGFQHPTQQLLTCRTPFDPGEPMKAGLEEIRRTIRKQEPQKPSTFVGTMESCVRMSVAQRRQTESGLLRGDPDRIVM